MKTVLQNTDEWLALRQTRLGASEANIVMGVSDYSTPRQLWTHKINPNPQKSAGTYITNKGHKTEPRLRAYLEIHTGYDFPDLVALSEEYEWLMASLDGYCAELNANAEFKLVGQEDFDLVVSGQILPQYKPQVHTQMLVNGAQRCFFVVGAEDKENPDLDDRGRNVALKFAILEVTPDLQYIGQELFPELKKFWFEYVLKKVQPPPHPMDVVELGNPELKDMLARYKLLLEEQEDVDKRVDKLKKDIFKFTRKYHTKVSCEGTKIYEIQEKDGLKIDFKQWVEDKNLDVPEAYKSVTKGKKVQKITLAKEKKEEEEKEPG